MSTLDTHLCVAVEDDMSMPPGSENANRPSQAALGAADWLCLAAAPTFALMALLTSMPGGGMPEMLCSSMQVSSPFGGMVPMYVLMSAFHSAPWLRLLSGRRGGACARLARGSMPTP